MALTGVEIPILLATLVVGPLALVSLVVVAVLSARSASGPLPQTARAARRHAIATTAVASAVGLLAAVVASVVAATSTGLAIGLWTGLVPALAGLAFVGVHAAGEATWPRQAGQVRRASLQRRTAADVAPRLLRTAATTWAASLVVALIAFGLLADESGRAFRVTFADSSSTAGPFPGWFYGVPLLAATAVVALVTWGALHLVAARAAVADAAPHWDLALRRLSAHRILRGTQGVLGLTLAGVLGVAGNALRTAGSGSSIDGVAQVDVLATGSGVTLMIASATVLLTTLVVLLVPGAPASLGAEPAAGPAPEGDRP